MKTKTMMVALATLLIGSFCFWACQKDEPISGKPDTTEHIELKTGHDESDYNTHCIDPDYPVYFEQTDQQIITWGGRHNDQFSKTVAVKYYNTLTHFMLEVMSTNGIADVLMNDESVKDFEGTIEENTWHEIALPLSEDWQAFDPWSFELKITGFGPPAYFEVQYELIGECDDGTGFTLSLSVNPEDAGIVTGAGKYMEGEEVNLTTTISDGYVFVNWTDTEGEEISDESDFTYTMPAYNVALIANFDEEDTETPIDMYTLSLAVNPENAGIVTGAGEYAEGDEVNLTATASDGYVFVNWTDGIGAEISDIADFTYTMPGGDITLTANFHLSPIYYTLTLNVNPLYAGTVQGAGEYLVGQQVQIFATASFRWEFVNWTDGVGAEISDIADFTFTMPAQDIALTANFHRILTTLTLIASPEEGGTVNGAGEYLSGQVEVTAEANQGWEFVIWTGDIIYLVESDIYSPSIIVFVPNHDITLTAHFQEEYDGWPRDTETQVVDVLNPTTGKTWMDRNLGASRAATSSTDAEAYGDLYQWGRPADGHQKRNSLTTNTLSSTDQPGHGDFILAPDHPYNWRSPKNDQLWQGVNGINNPCPIGYRLPTHAELIAERDSWSSMNSAGAYASPLKLTVAGSRLYNNGGFHGTNSFGHYWSSTFYSDTNHYSASFGFHSWGTSFTSSYRANGYSVRCIKD